MPLLGLFPSAPSITDPATLNDASRFATSNGTNDDNHRVKQVDDVATTVTSLTQDPSLISPVIKAKSTDSSGWKEIKAHVGGEAWDKDGDIPNGQLNKPER